MTVSGRCLWCPRSRASDFSSRLGLLIPVTRSEGCVFVGDSCDIAVHTHRADMHKPADTRRSCGEHKRARRGDVHGHIVVVGEVCLAERRGQMKDGVNAYHRAGQR